MKQTSLFPSARSLNRMEVRIDYDVKADAQKKARSEGYTLSYLVKCFIAGYLTGDILGSEIVKYGNK